MSNGKLQVIAGAIAALSLAACGTTNSPYPPGIYPGTASAPVTNVPNTVIAGYGVVQGIDLVPRESAGIGAGTIAGAVVGGVLGNQVGSGTGRTAATIAGAAGGAMAGHQIEKGAQSQAYRITMRMDDGTVQSIVQESQPTLRIGDRIRIVNGVVERL
ncbi:MAG: glycine zipper 2TM domain-containing protein [Burkholderiales bacterium]|nr:glycine zipper 2TM domain-containing protein [Burkholderiales bacterium]